jgi:hypothetical protein
MLNQKYTCDCCGYKTVLDNIGNICPVCFWENDFFDDEWFYFSETNKASLYDAQENYKINGCSRNVWLSKCRKPQKDEVKDINWISIQEQIEENISLEIIDKKIQELGEKLSRPNADNINYNFHHLPQIEFIQEDYDGSKHLDYDQYLLFALFKKLLKENQYLLKGIFKEFYKKGNQLFNNLDFKSLIIN